jgi:hypothetical protein
VRTIELSPELIGSVFSGLVLLVGALATYTATRSRRLGEDQRVLRRSFRDLQKKYLAAIAHLFKLETELAERGLEVPARPAALEADDDDDPPIVPTPAPPPPPSSGATGASG